MKRLSMTVLLALATIGLPTFTASVNAQNDGDRQEDRTERGRNRGQRGGPRGGRETGLMGLLRVEEVQKEVQLTEDQLAAIQAFGEEAIAGRPEFPSNFREMSEEEQSAFRKSMEEWSTKQNAEAKSVLVTLLEPEQFERLMQISIQQQGSAALNDADVAAKLNLSDEQRTKIAEAIKTSQETLRTEMRAAFQGGQGGGDREAMTKKFAELRAASEQSVLAELTDEQKTTLAALKGDAFEMPQRGFGGRGAGPGGQERRNRSGDPE